MKYYLLIAAAVAVVFLILNKPIPKANPVKVSCQTTKGELQIMVMPEWSPLGAARFLEMIGDGFYKDVPFFRCMEGFVCQFGAVPPRADFTKKYSALPDDPPIAGLRDFQKGYLSFAGYAPNSRTTHLFITMADGIQSLGSQPWETPIGFVTEQSMRDTVSKLTTSYGETRPNGNGPEIAKIEAPDGADYIKREFPNLDAIQSCAIVQK